MATGNGVELATAYVSLTVEASNVGREVTRALDPVSGIADKTGKDAGKRMTGGMGSAFKGIGGLFAGAMAGIGVKDFLGDALAEARESQKVGALTESVIKSTGGAAKTTAAEVGALATAISKKTGIDDEAIQTGSNLLLTFKNVRNEVGSGNDIFNQATQAAVDLSAAGFGSVDSASKMLGKALNDPIKGISALSRAGVTFTAEQKEQIKTMVESGDTLGAQKMIMSELQSQVGGAAEATATAGDKAKVAMGNLKEVMGTALLPIVDKVATVFTEKVAPAIEAFVLGFQNGEGAGGKFRDIMQGVWDVIQPVGQWLFDNISVVGAFVGTIGGLMVLEKVTGAVKAFNMALKANPIGLIITAIGLLVAGLVWLYQNNEDARRIMDAAWAKIKEAIQVVVTWVREVAWPWMKEAWDKISGAISKAWEGTIKPALTAFWGFIRDTLWPFIKDFWENGIKPTFEMIGAVIKFVWENVIKPALSALWGFIKDTLWPFIKDFYENGIKPTFEGIAAVIKWAWDNVIKPTFDFLKQGVETLVTAFSETKEAIGRVWDGIVEKIKGPLETAKNWINDYFIKPLNSLFDALNIDINIPTIGGSGRDPFSNYAQHKAAQVRASGGFITGYSPTATSDNIPIWATAGEYVLPVDATNKLRKRFGGGFLEALRRGMPGFASGGLVDKGWEWLKGVGTHAMDWAAAAASALKDPLGTLMKLVKKVVPGDSPLLSIPNKLLPQIVDWAVEKIKSIASSLLGEGSPGAWQGIWARVQQIYPGVRLTDSTRPAGTATATGATSLHSLGRAIDVAAPDLYALHRAIAAALGTSPTELIGPIKSLNVSRGTHAFGTVTNATTLAGHKDHVHIGYARGGPVSPFVADQGVTLAPGLNLLDNRLARPEPLARADQPVRLHPDSVRDIALAVEAGAARGVQGVGRSLSMGGI